MSIWWRSTPTLCRTKCRSARHAEQDRPYGRRQLDLDDLFTERLRFEIDPRWQGEIPRTMLIARDGTTTIVEGVANPKQVRHVAG
jgi:hypothetical protein